MIFSAIALAHMNLQLVSYILFSLKFARGLNADVVRKNLCRSIPFLQLVNLCYRDHC